MRHLEKRGLRRAEPKGRQTRREVRSLRRMTGTPVRAARAPPSSSTLSNLPLQRALRAPPGCPPLDARQQHHHPHYVCGYRKQKRGPFLDSPSPPLVSPRLPG